MCNPAPERFEVICSICGKKIIGFNSWIGFADYFTPCTWNETLEDLNPYYNPTSVCSDCKSLYIKEVCADYEYK